MASIGTARQTRSGVNHDDIRSIHKEDQCNPEAWPCLANAIGRPGAVFLRHRVGVDLLWCRYTGRCRCNPWTGSCLGTIPAGRNPNPAFLDFTLGDAERWAGL